MGSFYPVATREISRHYFTLTRVIRLIYVCTIFLVIERIRDLIYLKIVATDFSLKITTKMVPITGRASS